MREPPKKYHCGAASEQFCGTPHTPERTKVHQRICQLMRASSPDSLCALVAARLA